MKLSRRGFFTSLGALATTQVLPTVPSIPLGMTTPETIRLGSRGEPVQKWQEFLKIPADGIFGPQTQQATITYQSLKRSWEKSW